MGKIGEEVLIGLIRRGIEIEESNIDAILKLFVAEEDHERRISLYVFLRDSEYHKSILIRCLRTLKGEVPELPLPKNDVFREMLTNQRMVVLKEIITVIRDYYTCLLEDVKQAKLDRSIDIDKIEIILANIQILLNEKEEQLKTLEKIKVF